jgi:hypothetical protein
VLRSRDDEASRAARMGARDDAPFGGTGC